jgi:hypothetical protein
MTPRFTTSDPSTGRTPHHLVGGWPVAVSVSPQHLQATDEVDFFMNIAVF